MPGVVKITFEDEPGIAPTPKYYHINYRKYPEGTSVETFSAASVARVGKKISEVDDALLHPASRSGLQVDKKRQVLQPGDSLWIDLPQGENAVYEISFQLANADSTAYAQLMRNLIFKADF